VLFIGYGAGADVPNAQGAKPNGKSNQNNSVFVNLSLVF
jgi:hypothetical protein